jgi:hypothetical protein
VLVHHAVPRDLLVAVPLVVDRHAIRRPVRLPTDGLRALLMPKLWGFYGLKPSGARPLRLMASTSGVPPPGINDVLVASQQMQAEDPAPETGRSGAPVCGREREVTVVAESCPWPAGAAHLKSATGGGLVLTVSAMTCRSASFSEAVITGARGTSEL